MTYARPVIFSSHDRFREICHASTGIILSVLRLEKGMTLEPDKKELREFGSCLQALCEKGASFSHPSQEEHVSMFPKSYSDTCIEGPYIALKVEREYIQSPDSPDLSARLKSIGVTSLDELAHVLQSDSLKPEQYPAVQEVFEKWHALAEEMVAVGRDFPSNLVKVISDLVLRFPSRH